MRLILASLVALAISSTALAADDIMANYYGNTVIGKSAAGESRTHYKADHTFDSALSSAQGSMDTRGTWALNDKREICRTYETPVPGMPNPACVLLTAHKVGDKWQVVFNGRTSDVSLVAGIQ